MAPLSTISLNDNRLNNNQFNTQSTAVKPILYTIAQRDALLHDLELELNNRISRLRAQYQLAATALRTKLENRINRIPKKLWSMTLRQLNEVHQHSVSPIKKPIVMKETAKLDALKIPKLRKATPMRVKPSPMIVETPRTRTRAQTQAKEQATRRKQGTASVIRKASPIKRPLRSTRTKNTEA